MRYSGKHLMSLCLMVIAVGVIITAMKWPFKTALFPLIVSVFLFFGAMADFLLNLFGSKEIVAKQGAVDFQLSEESIRHWPPEGLYWALHGLSASSCSSSSLAFPSRSLLWFSSS